MYKLFYWNRTIFSSSILNFEELFLNFPQMILWRLHKSSQHIIFKTFASWLRDFWESEIFVWVVGAYEQNRQFNLCPMTMTVLGLKGLKTGRVLCGSWGRVVSGSAKWSKSFWVCQLSKVNWNRTENYQVANL